MNTEHTQIPAEVREAIARHIYNTPYDGLFVPMRTNVDALCAALAPLWPKPAPAPSDAEVAAAVERLKDIKPTHVLWGDEQVYHGLKLADLRTVLAALAEAQRDKERLASLLKESVRRLDEYAIRQGRRRMTNNPEAPFRMNDQPGNYYPTVQSLLDRAKAAIEEARR